MPDSRAVARAFSGAVERAKIRPRITYHGLRKTTATRMLQGGADIKPVRAIGSWNDPATLIGVYSASSEEAKRAAVAKL